MTEEMRGKLDELYRQYNRREYVSPDPLEVLYSYDDTADREIVALVASSLAFGRVGQILKKIFHVLEKMQSPPDFLHNSSRKELERTFADFKHRWVTGTDLSAMLHGAGKLISKHGSLEGAFSEHVKSGQQTALPALKGFLKDLHKASGNSGRNRLLPDPDGGSALKRFNLFLRWMVRRDDVDPGGWSCIGPDMLLVPLDTHMHSICRHLDLTDRKQADMKTVLQITDAFRKVHPQDPVRYDFALTRLGIREEIDKNSKLKRFFH